MPKIASGDYEIGLDPKNGGGLTFLRFRGADVLRPAPAVPTGPLDLACFPLVPYANRVANGRLVWQGRKASLRPNLDGQAHPLHGDGWLAAWSVAGAASDRIVLEMHHPAGAWPWAYAARQTIRADAKGVSLELEVTNLSDGFMPAGLGYHPYFPHRSTARLQAKVEAVWQVDDQLLPTQLGPSDQFGDFGAGAPLATPGLIDNCYEGWPGEAEIRLSDTGPVVRLTTSPELRWLHVYSQPGQDHFCVAPVSHRPNALNAERPMTDGVIPLPPGLALRASMRIEVS